MKSREAVVFSIRPSPRAWLDQMRRRSRIAVAPAAIAIVAIALLIARAVIFGRGAGPDQLVFVVLAVAITASIVYVALFFLLTELTLNGNGELVRSYGPFARRWAVTDIRAIRRCSIVIGSLGIPQAIWCFISDDERVVLYLPASMWKATDVAELAGRMHLAIRGAFSDSPPAGINEAVWYARLRRRR